MKTIEFLKSLQLKSGGLAAWEGEKAYPECTGYLIPTLLSYGEKPFANNLADWLESIQNKDGSFDGLDGVPRTFDTGACYEGLTAAGRTKAAERALVWMKSMLKDGMLRIYAGTDETHIYNLRPLALIGEKLESPPKLPPTRTHYTAYALEGLYNMGFDISTQLKEYSKGRSLLHFDNHGGSDTCATAQIAVLCLKNNIPCEGLVEAVRAMVDDDGGVYHGSGDSRKCLWTAKYYLDMERLATQKAAVEIKETKNHVRTGKK